MDRFWQMESDQDDPIGLWMTVPLLTFEPPASVLQRVWTGLVELARSDRPGDHAVCCTHSGPMRVFSKGVFGDDLGEPGNCEELRVRLVPPFVEASVTFRGLTRRVPVPRLDGAPPPRWPHS
jgi:broad specificity phosphatase PhoE